MVTFISMENVWFYYKFNLKLFYSIIEVILIF